MKLGYLLDLLLNEGEVIIEVDGEEKKYSNIGAVDLKYINYNVESYKLENEKIKITLEDTKVIDISKYKKIRLRQACNKISSMFGGFNK